VLSGPEPGEQPARAGIGGQLAGEDRLLKMASVNAAGAKLTGFGALGETMEVDGHGNFDVHFSYLVLKA
jgi:hypothetical protein